MDNDLDRNDKNAVHDYSSMLKYYQALDFNPVFIPLETRQQWEAHLVKRLNLYQRHLGIPLGLLRNRSVLEFGPNSGENALVLAGLGAKLTLVEPNDQVLPRLQELFQQYQLEQQIAELRHQGIDEFQATQKYDLVIAEGFLFTLPNRDALIRKMGSLLVPGGLAVISFNDRFGCLLEITKQVIFWRACQLAGINEVQSDQALEIARRLFLDAFSKLSASRSFETWWRDTIVSPFVASKYLWSYPELLPLIEQAGCMFYSSSPRWAFYDQFQWYKAITPRADQQRRLMENWRQTLPYFLTGLPLVAPLSEVASEEVVQAIARWVDNLSKFTTPQNPQASIDLLETLTYPDALDVYLSKSSLAELNRFNVELRQLYAALHHADLAGLINTYLGLTLSQWWGSAYHYVCFANGFDNL